MEILRASMAELMVLLFTMLACIILILKEIRKSDKKLNPWGWIFIITLVGFGGLSAYLIVDNKTKGFDEDQQVIRKIESDSIYRQQQSLALARLENELSSYKRSDSAYKAVLKKGFDSLGRIISRNERVGKNEDDLQNPKDEIKQALETNLDAPRKLDDAMKEETLAILEGRKDQKINIVCLEGDSEAFIFATQLKNFLVEQGFSITGVDRTYGEPVVGLMFDAGTSEIIVGSKPH